VPEGDTVYLSAKNLDRVLAGAVVTRFDLRVPAYASLDLTGERIENVVSAGKHLLMRVGEYTIHSHLKMEGSWHLYKDGTAWRRPEWQARAIIGIAGWTAVGFQLGTLEAAPREREGEFVDYLGPDLLGAWDAAEAERRLLADPGVPVFVAVQQQRNLAGLGNEYANELCFLAGLAPTTPIAAVPNLPKMLGLAHRVIHANKDRAVRSTTGNLRSRQTSWVYGRAGEQCRRCGTRIRKGSLGPTPLIQRDVYWCEVCQPQVVEGISGV
jgi:endonuclease VIII